MNLESDFQILFDQKRYSEIVDKSRLYNVEPVGQPILSKFLAASLFCLGSYPDAENILISLESSFSNDPNFISLYAATCRRLAKFARAEELFNIALNISPDSIPIRNNYANLLIDLSRFDEARSLLASILEADPLYQDAQDNLSRLNALSLASPDIELSTLPSKHSDNSLEFQDPLLFAFESSEVEHSLKRYNMSNKDLSNAQKSLADLPDPAARDIALDFLDGARQAISEGNSELVLHLCTKAFDILGPNSEIYDLVSDAYINLTRPSDAEKYILHSISLDGPTLKRCFNLVSFALMRNDILLARFYLKKAFNLDPSSPDLRKLEDLVRSHETNTNSKFNFSESYVVDSLVKN